MLKMYLPNSCLAKNVQAYQKNFANVLWYHNQVKFTNYFLTVVIVENKKTRCVKWSKKKISNKMIAYCLDICSHNYFKKSFANCRLNSPLLSN